jgi:hypothetical protein
MGPLDLTTKTAAIVIILILMTVCAVAAGVLAFFPQTHELCVRFTETFFALLGTLLLALNIDRHSGPPPAPAGE